MSNSSVSMRSEDEMLRFAYVEAKVEKTYAVRFNGYPDDIPHFFKRDLVNKNIRGHREQVIFNAARHDDSEISHRTCRIDEWIVVTDMETTIYSDAAFRRIYKKVQDLLY